MVKLLKSLNKDLLIPKQYNIATFNVSDKNINNFYRISAHPTDCVINALEILGAIDKVSAGLMRILIAPEQKGIAIDVIQNIFSFFFPTQLWAFRGYYNVQIFAERLTNNLNTNTVSFCGMQFKTGERHAFLLGKDSFNKFWIIDGQNGLCDLSEERCVKYLANGVSWYILECMK